MRREHGRSPQVGEGRHDGSLGIVLVESAGRRAETCTDGVLPSTRRKLPSTGVGQDAHAKRTSGP